MKHIRHPGLSASLPTYVSMHTQRMDGEGIRRGARTWLLLLRVGFALVLSGILAIFITYRTVPNHNSDATYFDTLIVLGSPPDPDGKPSTEQRERVMEAVRQYRAGRAAAIIVSGGETLPGLVEADTMALVAKEAGVPADKVIEERQALDTVQNIFFSHQIMQQHGWTTAEVVSSPSHLPRAALILEHWNFGWRVQAGHWPDSYSLRRIAPHYLYEALGTTALRWFGFRRSPFLPSRSR